MLFNHIVNSLSTRQSYMLSASENMLRHKVTIKAVDVKAKPKNDLSLSLSDKNDHRKNNNLLRQDAFKNVSVSITYCRCVIHTRAGDLPIPGV